MAANENLLQAEKLWQAIESYDLSMAKLAIESGANVNQSNKDGYTSLHLAAQHGCKEIIGYLYKVGANILAKNHEDLTPKEVAGLEEYYCIEIQLQDLEYKYQHKLNDNLISCRSSFFGTKANNNQEPNADNNNEKDKEADSQLYGNLR